MPGVPSSRGCEACRKQKKKCDQSSPSCSRCTRLGSDCVGAGQQRFKFIGTSNGSAKSASSQALAVRTRAVKMTTMIPRTPYNELTTLSSTYAAAVHDSGDLRFNLAFSFFPHLQYSILPRLGVNEALDAAALTLAQAHSNHCSGRGVTTEALANFSKALRALRICLDDPVQALSSETFCAVHLICTAQTVMGLTQWWSLGHARGIHQLLKLRINKKQGDDLEVGMLGIMRLMLIAEALINGTVQLTPQEWSELIPIPADDPNPMNHLVRSLYLLPGLMDSWSVSKNQSATEMPHLKEIEAGYLITRQSLFEWRQKILAISSKRGRDFDFPADAYTVREGSVYISFALIVICSLKAVYPDRLDLAEDADVFSALSLEVGELCKNFRPISGNMVALQCLSTSWCATSDPILKLALQGLLSEYYEHPSWGSLPRTLMPMLKTISSIYCLQRPRLAASSSGTTTPHYT